MRLADLNPTWVAAHDANGLHEKAGVEFDCPHCAGRPEAERLDSIGNPCRVHVLFTNPVDGAPLTGFPVTWARGGMTFDDLSLTPSINFRGGVHLWHGYVTEGAITFC